MALIPVALRRGGGRGQPSTTVRVSQDKNPCHNTMVFEGGGGGMHTPLNLALGVGGVPEFKISLMPGHKKSSFSGISSKHTSILKSPG